MLTKKEFTDAMNAIVAQNKADDEICRAITSFCNDSCFYDTKYATRGLLDLLVSTMQDKCEWIEYWLYELDCGAKYRPSSVTQDGKPIKLKTITDLYALLKKEYEDKK
jgi:hypothetical protein